MPNDPGLLTKKKCKDKVRWVATEEATTIATFLTQKEARNTSESGFKPMVWSLVVQEVAGATTNSSKKDACNVRCVISR